MILSPLIKLASLRYVRPPHYTRANLGGGGIHVPHSHISCRAPCFWIFFGCGRLRGIHILSKKIYSSEVHKTIFFQVRFFILDEAVCMFYLNRVAWYTFIYIMEISSSTCQKLLESSVGIAQHSDFLFRVGGKVVEIESANVHYLICSLIYLLFVDLLIYSFSRSFICVFVYLFACWPFWYNSSLVIPHSFFRSCWFLSLLVCVSNKSVLIGHKRLW